MGTKKKTTSISKRPVGLKVPGTKKIFHREFRGQDPKIMKYAKKKPDNEAAPPPEDDAAKLKYPPPKNDPIFRAKWSRFIDNVSSRKNFNIAHLDQLEILCDLFVEYSEAQAFLRVNGRSYEAYGRSGKVIRPFPEVAQVSRIQAQIKEYLKMLGLLLQKDAGTTSGGEDKEWK